jgi:hypothetical protein
LACTETLIGVNVPEDADTVPVVLVLAEKYERSRLTETDAGASADTLPLKLDSLIQGAEAVREYGSAAVL